MTVSNAIDDTPERMLVESLYQDTGCSDFASCLNCPLPMCKYDDPDGVRIYRRQIKDRQVATAYAADPNRNVNKLAERFQLTERSIYRILSRARREQPDLAH